MTRRQLLALSLQASLLSGCGSANHLLDKVSRYRKGYGGRGNTRMAYSPTSPFASTNLHSYIDPNGGTCFTDVGATAVATNNGDVILANMDPSSALIGLAIGGRSATLQTSGIKCIQVDNSNINTGGNGAAIKYTTGSLDAANQTCIMVFLPDRLCTTVVADLLYDPANSPGGTGAKVCRVTHSNGWIRRYSGSGFSNTASPYISPTSRPYLLGITTNSGVLTFYRRDHYDSSGNLIGVGGGVTITSDLTTLGYTMLANSGATTFTSGKLFFAIVANTGKTAAEIKAEMDNIITYLEGFGPAGIRPSTTAPLLIVNGDSDALAIGTTRLTEAWPYQLQQDLITAGVAGLELVLLAAATRQVTHADDLEQVIGDLANATNRRVLYVFNCGKNDLTVVDEAALKTRLETHFGNLNTLSRKMGIIWCGVSSRTDLSGGTQTNYDTNRADMRTLMIADPTLAGRIFTFIDHAGDSKIGPDGAAASTTYFLSDHVHVNNTGSDVLYSSSDGYQVDGSGATLLSQCKRFFLGGGTRIREYPRGIGKGMAR